MDVGHITLIDRLVTWNPPNKNHKYVKNFPQIKEIEWNVLTDKFIYCGESHIISYFLQKL